MSRRRGRGRRQGAIVTNNEEQDTNVQVNDVNQSNNNDNNVRLSTTLGLKAPTWSKDGKEFIHKFILDWGTYQREILSRINNGEPVRGLKMIECVDPILREDLLAHEYPRDPAGITDDEFMTFLKNRIKEKDKKFLRISELPKLYVDFTIDIPAGRATKLYGDMKRILRGLGCLHYIDEPSKITNKLIVEWLFQSLPAEARAMLEDETMELRESSEGLTLVNMFNPLVKILEDQDKHFQNKKRSFKDFDNDDDDKPNDFSNGYKERKL
jgi:hypothetical protein